MLRGWQATIRIYLVRSRAGTQIEAARKKARLGMELAGLPLGLASEGAFGPDPMTGMFP